MICSFCTDKHIDLEIAETEFWKISVPSHQPYLGYCVVLLKRHAGDLAELTAAEWADYAVLLSRLEKALRDAFAPALFNWSCLMNLAIIMIRKKMVRLRRKFMRH